MVRDDRLYLEDMLLYTRLIRHQSRGRSREDLESDVDFTHLILYRIGVIGEAACQISSSFKERHPELEWRKIVGTRNRIHHEYFSLDYDIVWDVATNELSALTSQLEQLISSLQIRRISTGLPPHPRP